MGFWEFDDPPTQQVKAQVVDLDHHSSAREEAHEKDFFQDFYEERFHWDNFSMPWRQYEKQARSCRRD